MLIVDGWPPIIDKIDAVFHVKERRDIIFAWGDTIYAPHGQFVPFELRAHEAVHGSRQMRHPESIEGWWLDYLQDPEFRLVEEVPAHYAELNFMCAGANRAQRRRALSIVAKKLASPLYRFGSLMNYELAKRILEIGPEQAQAILRDIPEELLAIADAKMNRAEAGNGGA